MATTITSPVLKNAFGSVRPYTRHLTDCKAVDDSCRCPKWLYEHRLGCARKRYTLNTPSWAEAQRIAADKLRSFDPEIAAARSVTEKRNAALMTVKDAGDLWIKRTKNKFGEDAGSVSQYRSLMKMVERWAAREHIDYIQDITSLQLERWQQSHDWTRLAVSTRKQRWGVLRSVFAYLKVHKVLEMNPIEPIERVQTPDDHVQGPYTVEQIDAIFAHIDASVPENIDVDERSVYATRLHAFVTLLLNVGCDLIDAVQFDQTLLTDDLIDDHVYPVYRYRREKTNVRAVIPVTEDVAAILRSVPMLRHNPKDMPFRDPSIKTASDVHTWSRRIASVLKAAEVEYIELPRGKDGSVRRKPANAKQFRHTFAVRQLEKRLRPEVVARQLGHVDTTMVRRHYAPWVPTLDDEHIRESLGL